MIKYRHTWARVVETGEEGMGIWKGCDVIYGGYQKMKAKTTNQNSQRNQEANDQTGGLTIKKLP